MNSVDSTEKMFSEALAIPTSLHWYMYWAAPHYYIDNSHYNNK